MEARRQFQPDPEFVEPQIQVAMEEGLETVSIGEIEGTVLDQLSVPTEITPLLKEHDGPHYFKIPSPDGVVSIGTCKDCGFEKPFKNFFEPQREPSIRGNRRPKRREPEEILPDYPPVRMQELIKDFGKKIGDESYT